ncbi:hypothetical protein BD410DRAFT_830712 [Rickenella mellea]|uniref:Uncharacterized protein n=1 Tax=Rickenella mellea TaxID=50990 RepID=A0A4Y7PTX9_9AGAM|nr:hypothetical protein BD410DRAFT_830712 [Rickenella mellea]
MMELAILSTSWKLVRAITEIVDRIEQTREDARSLKYLGTQATTFLTIVTNGLADEDPAPYRETIASLEVLYKDILTTSEKYILDGKIKQMWKASKTRRNILNLNRRMRLFIDTYLLQVATETARLNIRAFAEPPPPLPPISTSSEKAMWKVMSWSNRTTTKPLPLVSDPMNPLLTPPHSQNTTYQWHGHPQTLPHARHHTNSSPTSTPDKHPGTTNSTCEESPPGLPRVSRDPLPPSPPARRIKPPVEPHTNLGSSRSGILPPPISSSGQSAVITNTSSSSLYNPRVRSPTSSMHSLPELDRAPITESNTESKDESNSYSPKPSGSSDNGSVSTESVLSFFSAISQHQSEAATPTSPPPPSASPLPSPAVNPTPRRPDFHRRLQALRDCTYSRNVNNTWLDLKRDEILYTDGKKVTSMLQCTPPGSGFTSSRFGGRSYTGIMAQNGDGKCGHDPETSLGYLKYLE